MMRAGARVALTAVAFVLLGPRLPRAAPAPSTPVEVAEQRAAAAVAMLPGRPAEALAEARQALTLTVEFVPTAFVRAGRKGEVVEDSYQAARDVYRRHRAKLYEAVGLCLAAQGESLPATRYLRRAVDLDARLPHLVGLARTLLAQGRGREALLVLERAIGPTDLDAEVAALLGQAADFVGRPSAQSEIDRVRLRAQSASGIEYRDGPFPLPGGLRLSTSPVFRLEDAPQNVFYLAEASCRSCSEDLQVLKRGAPKEVRVLLLPEAPDHDQALRQVVDLYRYGWPLLLGKGIAEALRLEPRSALAVGRGGWAGAVVKAPFGASLPGVFAVFARNDLTESLPRAKWNHRPVERPAVQGAPGLLPEGLAPGEDLPAPPEFEAAVEAYRAKRPAEALRGFESLEARGDGFLLPPEGRLNRALCLAALGRRDDARRLLLKTGDSRLQEDVDRALETVSVGLGKE